MAKTLIIAEKPSVGRDLARVLPGSFEVGKGIGERNARWLEGPDHVVSWAVGHLVQLAEPDAYGKEYKSWKMETLPIVPKNFNFKHIVRDDQSKKQMRVLTNLFGRDDIDLVINACDAGREGELIFRWIYQQAQATHTVKRLWLSSMTDKAMERALADLRDSSSVDLLAAAAQSRAEADWLVGMNATRAATIRLRSSFDGAVSLGRVQTPTLAILARREEEIRAFVPEPYWLVDAKFKVDGDGDRGYIGRLYRGSQPRLTGAEEAEAVAAAVTGKQGTITKLDKTRRKERAPLLYDLTTLQREAGSRFGFTARRTLAAAQRCYEEHKALTYPRTSSRYLTGDMIPEIKPIAKLVGSRKEYAAASKYVQGLDSLPLGRVVNDAKVADHHAIIPTNSTGHPVDKMNEDDRKIYDLVVRRFLAVFHPEAEFENTRIETTVEIPVTFARDGETVTEEKQIFRTRGRVLLVPGWRGVYEAVEESAADDEDEGATQTLPKVEQGEVANCLKSTSLEKITKPPRRYSDASLLGAMETAGQLVDDEEAREAMKESGIGTPATRAAIIERLIDVGYCERDGRALLVTEKGLNVIRLLNEHPITSPSLTGEWESRLSQVESGGVTRLEFMEGIAKFADETVKQLDKTLEGVRVARAVIGDCPVCGQDIVENRKGYSCWQRTDPGCGFVIWKAKAGKTLNAQVVKELVKTGRTEKQVTGFKSRAGRNFRAKLALMQNDEGRWRVEFDEPWAKEGTSAAPDAAEVDTTDTAVAGASDVSAEQAA